MKNPPKFNFERSFERYRDEVKCWSEITSIDKAKRGTLLVLSLPEGGKYGESADFCLNQVKGYFQSQDNDLHVYQLP